MSVLLLVRSLINKANERREFPVIEGYVISDPLQFQHLLLEIAFVLLSIAALQ